MNEELDRLFNRFIHGLAILAVSMVYYLSGNSIIGDLFHVVFVIWMIVIVDVYRRERTDGW